MKTFVGSQFEFCKFTSFKQKQIVLKTFPESQFGVM